MFHIWSDAVLVALIFCCHEVCEARMFTAISIFEALSTVMATTL